MTPADEIMNLRETIKVLKAILDEEKSKNEAAARRELAHLSQIKFLKALVEKLENGHRSEKIDKLLEDEELLPEIAALYRSSQPAEDAGVEDVANEEGSAEDAKRPRKKRDSGRQAIPANIERKEVIIDVPDAEKCACGKCGSPAMKLFDCETTEELEYHPEKFFVTLLKRLKYKCCDCDRNVVTAPLPGRVVPKGIPAASLVAHVVTAKFADHLPLHRLEGIIGRSGIEISRRTMCDWMAQAADHLEAIVAELKRIILAGPCPRMDATGVKLLAKKKTIAAHLWAYLKKNEIVVYDFTIKHNQDGPREFLAGYKGPVQCDCDPIYDPLFKELLILIEVACMAHCRRRFVDALGFDRKRAVAALKLFSRLYRAEAEMKKNAFTAEQRLEARRTVIKPLLEEFKIWLEDNHATTLPESLIGKAIKYARKHWVALTRFADNGDIEIDNNDTERALRHVAVGRKNWLFAGSNDGGRRAAILFSIVMTCKLNDIDPFFYLRDVLQERARNPQRNVAELTPMAWKASRDKEADDRTSDRVRPNEIALAQEAGT